MTALELAKLLTENDFNDDCPFCTKHSWNIEDHKDDCPFSAAYKIIKESEEGK